MQSKRVLFIESRFQPAVGAFARESGYRVLPYHLVSYTTFDRCAKKKVEHEVRYYRTLV